VGETIDVFAQFMGGHGPRLVFRVEARSGKAVVARGLHERAIVGVADLRGSAGRS
jgi:predicted thioesterase